MSGGPLRPLFLARGSYRRRRLADASRLLAVLGTLLFLLPLLWSLAPSGGPGLAGQAAYIFVVWLALILVAAILARRLRRAGFEPPMQRQPSAPETLDR